MTEPLPPLTESEVQAEQAKHGLGDLLRIDGLPIRLCACGSRWPCPTIRLIAERERVPEEWGEGVVPSRHVVYLFWQQKESRFGPHTELNGIFENEAMAEKWKRAVLNDTPDAYVWIEERETNHAFAWSDRRRLRRQADIEDALAETGENDD